MVQPCTEHFVLPTNRVQCALAWFECLQTSFLCNQHGKAPTHTELHCLSFGNWALLIAPLTTSQDTWVSVYGSAHTAANTTWPLALTTASSFISGTRMMFSSSTNYRCVTPWWGCNIMSDISPVLWMKCPLMPVSLEYLLRVFRHFYHCSYLQRFGMEMLEMEGQDVMISYYATVTAILELRGNEYLYCGPTHVSPFTGVLQPRHVRKSKFSHDHQKSWHLFFTSSGDTHSVPC